MYLTCITVIMLAEIYAFYAFLHFRTLISSR